MRYFVYILFSEKFKKHYTGCSSAIEMRLKSHNEFGHDWTARYRPWKVIFTKEFDLKEPAMQYEKWLKSGIGREFVKTLPH